MLTHSKPTETATYAYRADGLRVRTSKANIVNNATTPGNSVRYRYGGQMGTEDVESNAGGAVLTLSRYGLGARGIDVVSTTTSSGNTVSYPLYDAHGNNVGLLGKNGSSFTVSNEKSYDAWGGLRTGTNANGKAAYCANLGHKQDDESGFIYMRARYYESTSGRFVSQDSARDGINWFSYANNDSINLVDVTGKSASSAFAWAAAFFAMSSTFGFLSSVSYVEGNVPQALMYAAVGTAMLFSAIFAMAYGFNSLDLHPSTDPRFIAMVTGAIGGKIIGDSLKAAIVSLDNAIKAQNSVAGRLITGAGQSMCTYCAGYAIACLCILVAMECLD
jgi:RHS repeat-associated protein